MLILILIDLTAKPQQSAGHCSITDGNDLYNVIEWKSKSQRDDISLHVLRHHVPQPYQ
jgi:hypothetical protein